MLMKDQMSRFVIRYFERYIRTYLPDEPKELTRLAGPIYVRLMSEAPDMGDKGNMMRSNINITAAFFAYYEASDHRIDGKAMQTITDWLAQDYHWLTFLTDMNGHGYVRKLYYRMYEKHAGLVREHQAKGEWTGTWRIVMNPDHKEEGISYHMSNCPLLAFVRAHGYDDMMPYICRFDFIFEKLLHARLIRTQTEATGGEYCDYWFVPDRSKTAAEYKDFVSR